MMKARKVVPVAYAEVETNGLTFKVYADGRVLCDEMCEGIFEPYYDWQDDYEEVLAAGLAVLKEE